MPEADITEAQSLLSDIFGWNYAGHGDTQNALRRIGARHSISYGELWSLRYRPPKRIFADLLKRLRDAHAAERARQLRKLAHEHEITARIAGAAHPAVAAAAAVLRQGDAADPGPCGGSLADGPAEPPRPADHRLVDADLEPTPDRPRRLTTTPYTAAPR